MKNSVLKVHPSDNIMVALQYFKKGSVVSFEGKAFWGQDLSKIDGFNNLLTHHLTEIKDMGIHTALQNMIK